MDSVFIKVSTKDRLPSESGLYLTNNGHVHFLSGCKRFMGCDPQWWLEEVELPNYEDTRKARDAYSYSYLDPFRWGWKYGVKHILNTLKGEKSNG